MHNFKEFRNTLNEALPLFVWDETEKCAKRSTLGRHRTGALIFNRDYEAIGKGCSHHSAHNNRPSIHAEEHAIFEANGVARGNNIVIVTVTRGENYARSSRPCMKCLLHMNKVGIGEIIYAERLNTGDWIINQETPIEMMDRAARSYNRLDSFAKDMRVVYG